LRSMDGSINGPRRTTWGQHQRTGTARSAKRAGGGPGPGLIVFLHRGFTAFPVAGSGSAKLRTATTTTATGDNKSAPNCTGSTRAPLHTTDPRTSSRAVPLC
jgi:hypothetical protein